MTTKNYGDLKVFLPEKSVSYANSAMKPVHQNIWVSKQYRPRWSQKGLFTLPEIQHPTNPVENLNTLLQPYRADFDPNVFKSDLVWVDIGANERVDKGAQITITRLFGTTSGITGVAAGVLTAIAIANASITPAANHLALNSASAPPQNEFSTIGLTRAAATPQNYVAPASLDAVASVDLFKTFTITGNGTAYGAGVFDSTVASGSFLLAEKDFASGSAVLANGDTLQVTITITL